jgi:hypothetical protein
MRSTVAALIVLTAGVAAAQSLAEVARQEEARRKTVAGTGKVYTNEALQPAPPPSPGSVPAATQAPASPAAPVAPGADSAKPSDPAADPALNPEAQWKKRIADARDTLSRAQAFAEALQTRINVLSADFVNVDDPVKRGIVASDRDKALKELDRVKTEITAHQKMITQIQDEARKAGVPPGWVR